MTAGVILVWGHFGAAHTCSQSLYSLFLLILLPNTSSQSLSSLFLPIHPPSLCTRTPQNNFFPSQPITSSQSLYSLFLLIPIVLVFDQELIACALVQRPHFLIARSPGERSASAESAARVQAYWHCKHVVFDPLSFHPLGAARPPGLGGARPPGGGGERSHRPDNSYSLPLVLLVSCVLAMLLNLTMFVSVGLTSPMTFDAVSQAKLVCVLLIGYLVFGDTSEVITVRADHSYVWVCAKEKLRRGKGGFVASGCAVETSLGGVSLWEGSRGRGGADVHTIRVLRLRGVVTQTSDRVVPSYS